MPYVLSVYPASGQVGEFMDSPFVGAGFQLSSADVLIEIPFDPKLDMMFVGEEILYSARLWTNGWDMFAPDMNLVWHHYNRRVILQGPCSERYALLHITSLSPSGGIYLT